MAKSWGEYNPQLIIIDEINRADVSKVFGELLNALAEAGSSSGSDSVQLQYSGEKFCWPGNMRLVGTMNSADRSVGEIDQAIKRRFRLKEIKTDSKLFSRNAEFPFLKGLIDSIEDSVSKKDLDSVFKKLIPQCEESIDSFFRLYNQIGISNGFSEEDFQYVAIPSKSLENLHNAILKNREALFRVDSKLIGHSFHIQFSKDIIESFRRMVKSGVLTSKDAARELGNEVRL